MISKKLKIKLNHKVVLSFLATIILISGFGKVVEAEDIKSYNIDKGCYITVSDEISNNLNNSYFEGYMTFEYFDDDMGEIMIRSSTSKTAQFGDFSEVAKITKKNTKTWQKAKVEIFGDNINLNHTAQNNSDFVIKGAGKVRNIELSFTIFNKK